MCGNQVPYMTRQLRKAIMKRTELCSKYNKLKTLESLSGTLRKPRRWTFTTAEHVNKQTAHA